MAHCWPLPYANCKSKQSSAPLSDFLSLFFQIVSLLLSVGVEFCGHVLKHYYCTLTAGQRLSFHRTHSSPSCDRTHAGAMSKTHLCVLSYWCEPAWLLPHAGGMRGQQTPFFADTRLLQRYAVRTMRKKVPDYSKLCHSSTTKGNFQNKACLKSSIC